MSKNLDLSKSFIGVVEDNDDPKKGGRCRVRVLDVFDNIPLEDIPWAAPHKDLNGNQFIVPDIGKIVSVAFENDNLYSPQYKYAQEHNINLKKKLESLSGKAYTSMRALMFDHKTQIFSNDDEGLILDYMFNNIHMDKNSINMNLKSNGGSINMGSETANQKAILGNNFFDWFDTFVDELLGSNGGPYLGNMLSPVVPNPTLITVLLKYKALKDPKFLSKNVYINDNGQVDDIDRDADDQLGDNWTSTEKTNDLVSRDGTDFTDRSLGAPDGQLTPSSNPDYPVPVLSDSQIANQDPPEGEISPDINSILEVLRHKGYKIFTRPLEINTVGVRYQYPGMPYSDQFMDRLYAIWKDKNGKWKMKWWSLSTIPGRKPGRSDRAKGFKLLKDAVGKSRGGLGILKPAQYVDGLFMDYHKGSSRDARAMKIKGKQLAYRDQNYGDPNITFTNEDPKNATGGANFTMYIHKAYSSGSGKNTYGVQNWSEGCQVLNSPKALNQYFDLCERHKQKYGNTFTYTLITSRDVEDAELRLRNQ